MADVQTTIQGLSTLDDLIQGGGNMVDHLIVQDEGSKNSSWIGMSYQEVLDTTDPRDLDLFLGNLNQPALRIYAESMFLTSLSIANCDFDSISFQGSVFGNGFQVRNSQINEFRALQTQMASSTANSVSIPPINFTRSTFGYARISNAQLERIGVDDCAFSSHLSLSDCMELKELSLTDTTRLGGLVFAFNGIGRIRADIKTAALDPGANLLSVPIEFVDGIKVLESNW